MIELTIEWPEAHLQEIQRFNAVFVIVCLFVFTLTKLTEKTLLYNFPAGWSQKKAMKPKASHYDAALQRADLTCRCLGDESTCRLRSALRGGQSRACPHSGNRGSPVRKHLTCPCQAQDIL